MFLSLLDPGPKFDGFSGMSLAMLFLAAIVGGVWICVLAWRWFSTFPYLPDAAPPLNELAPEPPGVVNLLVNRCKVTHSAMLATFADLAARGYLEIQQLDREHFVARLRPHRLEGAALTGYEKQMVDFVRGRATGGSAPFEALLFDNEADAEQFHKRFRDSIVADARSRHLIQNRWGVNDLGVMGGLLGAALGLAAFAAGLAHLVEGLGSGEDKFGRWDTFWAAGALWVAVMLWIGAQRSIRYSKHGALVCAHWLGVQRYLQEGKAVTNVPIAAVVVWERYLSCGIALGVAHEAAEALPFAAEDPDTAWSRVGGDWREVRVEYPARFGACQSPGKVLFEGLVRAVFWGALAFIVLPVLGRVVFDGGKDIIEGAGLGTSEQERAIMALVGSLLLVFTVIGLYLTARFLGGAIRVWRGLLDLGAPQVIEGEVVKLHAGRVAIDDGEQREIVGWLPPAASVGLRRGMLLRVTKTRRLHYVSRVEVLAGGQPAPMPAEAVGGLPGTRLPAFAVDVASLQAASGLALFPVAAATQTDGGAFGQPQIYADTSGNRVAIRTLPLPPLAMRAISALSGRIGHDATPVPGLGSDAWWSAQTGLGVVTSEGLTLIQPELPGLSPDQHFALASSIARSLVGSQPDRDGGPQPSPSLA